MSSHNEDDNLLKGLSGGCDPCVSYEKNGKSNDASHRVVGGGNVNNNAKSRVMEITDTLIENFIFKTMQDTREIYRYDEQKGIFIKNGEPFIESQSESLCRTISTCEVNEVLNHIRRRTLTERKEFDSQIEWIACKNQMINLNTLETKHHDPDFMATVQIPVRFDPYICPDDNCCCSAKKACPEIKKFMSEVMLADDIQN